MGGLQTKHNRAKLLRTGTRNTTEAFSKASVILASLSPNQAVVTWEKGKLQASRESKLRQATFPGVQLLQSRIHELTCLVYLPRWRVQAYWHVRWFLLARQFLLNSCVGSLGTNARNMLRGVAEAAIVAECGGAAAFCCGVTAGS